MWDQNAAAYWVLLCCAIPEFSTVAGPQETTVDFSVVAYVKPELGYAECLDLFC